MKLTLILAAVCCTSVVNAQSYYGLAALGAGGLDVSDILQYQWLSRLANRPAHRQRNNVNTNTGYGTAASRTPAQGSNNRRRNNNRAASNNWASYYMMQNGPGK